MTRSCETIDPRIRRTRQLLQQALAKILKKKEFDEISVQDIAEEAVVNRATFYDHFADKFALLNCMVGGEFHELLTASEVQFDGACTGALRAIVLAVCDYLTRMQGPDCRRELQPHMEAAIIAVVRRTLLEGLKQHPAEGGAPPEMVAAAASWAIYGAAKEWLQTPERGSAEEVAEVVQGLVVPIFTQSRRAG